MPQQPDSTSPASPGKSDKTFSNADCYFFPILMSIAFDGPSIAAASTQCDQARFLNAVTQAKNHKSPKV